MRLPWQKPEPITLGQLIEEFVATYRAKFPGETPREVTSDWIEWERADGKTHKVMLGKIVHQVARLPKNTTGARRAIYEHFLRALFDGETLPDHFEAPEFAARVLPTIRERTFLDQTRQHANLEIPHRDLNAELIISYVIDFPDRVAHISEKQAQELDLDEAGLFDLALSNLRALYPREAFRAVFDPQPKIVGVVCADGHAAARLLLIREYLEAGEEVAVCVKDGAMMALVEVPRDGNWNPLRALARGANATGFSRPFWVSEGRIDLM